MPLFAPIRMQCRACGIVVEFPVRVTGLKFPLTIERPTLPALPTGWTHVGDDVFCNQHPQRQHVEEPTPADVRAVLDGAINFGGRPR